MELSRLSNSLGCVCSQRRGRLAAVAGRPRLPRSLSHHSPPFPSLQSHWSVFLCVCFCLIVHTSSLLQLTHEAVVLACPERRPAPSDTGPITNRVPKPTAARHTMVLCQQDAGFQPLLSLPPPANLKPEERERLWHGA